MRQVAVVRQAGADVIVRHAAIVGPHGLDTPDALIAATAFEEELTLATKNRKHFQMIRGLNLDVPNY